uniref:Uncharacterized protein n=1 Tax=Palpitomonas bilix TaxID=652834 RepID=A0A7S3LVK6_9EUKA|mmetsp:Transcript_49973/g.128608  ORF Transcript_49973/g.128608 Transcript_49973/m.128608 type:complete len:399 (+) Transcript_49973:157-1353(+)
MEAIASVVQSGLKSILADAGTFSLLVHAVSLTFSSLTLNGEAAKRKASSPTATVAHFLLALASLVSVLHPLATSDDAGRLFKDGVAKLQKHGGPPTLSLAAFTSTGKGSVFEFIAIARDTFLSGKPALRLYMYRILVGGASFAVIASALPVLVMGKRAAKTMGLLLFVLLFSLVSCAGTLYLVSIPIALSPTVFSVAAFFIEMSAAILLGFAPSSFSSYMSADFRVLSRAIWLYKWGTENKLDVAWPIQPAMLPRIAMAAAAVTLAFTLLRKLNPVLAVSGASLLGFVYFMPNPSMALAQGFLFVVIMSPATSGLTFLVSFNAMAYISLQLCGAVPLDSMLTSTIGILLAIAFSFGGYFFTPAADTSTSASVESEKIGEKEDEKDKREGVAKVEVEEE